MPEVQVEIQRQRTVDESATMLLDVPQEVIDGESDIDLLDWIGDNVDDAELDKAMAADGEDSELTEATAVG